MLGFKKIKNQDCRTIQFFGKELFTYKTLNNASSDFFDKIRQMMATSIIISPRAHTNGKVWEY